MSHPLPDIFVTTSDYERLSQLVHQLRNGATLELEEELARATVVPEFELPFAVVTMNSTVRVRDVDTGREMKFTLVFPENADASEGKISVLAPVGVALIGLRTNEIIEWPLPTGQSKKLQVISISHGTQSGP